jgi:hypothetical protein
MVAGIGFVVTRRKILVGWGSGAVSSTPRPAMQDRKALANRSNRVLCFGTTGVPGRDESASASLRRDRPRSPDAFVDVAVEDGRRGRAIVAEVPKHPVDVETARPVVSPDWKPERGAQAAPFPSARLLDELSSYRVQQCVAGHLVQVLVVFDQPTLEAVAEQVTLPPEPAIR